MAYYGTQKTSADPKSRVILIAVFFTALFLCLSGRLWYLQVIEEGYFKELSKNNRIRLHRVQALRGYIFDRNGKIYGENRPSFNVAIIPEDLKKTGNGDPKLAKEVSQKTLVLISKLINVPVKEIKRKIKNSKQRLFKPVIIKKDLPFAEVAKLEERKVELPGVYIEPQPARYYIHGKEASHVLGYMGKITEKQLKEPKFSSCKGWDMVGQSGIERVLNPYLFGTDGGEQVEVTAEGRVVKTIAKKDSIPGSNIYLTLDMELQRLAEEQLKDKSGSIVVMDPNNGEILALANSPAFDPNIFSVGISSENWRKLTRNPQKPMQNRAIQSEYASGSVFKIVTASAALFSNAVSPSETLFCGGTFRLGRWSYDCWKDSGHGKVDIHDAMVHSCNVFFYQVALKAGIDALDDFALAYGLGKETGIDLPSERRGLVPTPQWKKKRTHERWYKGDTVSLSIGQGYLTATPLQLAVLISTVANNGTRYKPMIIKKIVDSDDNTIKEFLPKVVGRVRISKEDLDIIKDGLRGVVNEKGTGVKARIPGVVVAGKTGTAQVVVKKDFHDKDQKNLPRNQRDNAWFVAFAPFENPVVAAAVLVEHGGHGGSACAPITKKLFELYLAKLDMLPEPETTKDDAKKEQKKL